MKRRSFAVDAHEFPMQRPREVESTVLLLQKARTLEASLQKLDCRPEA